eukprot:12551782-Prorocentrum_lima.AAC.1
MTSSLVGSEMCIRDRQTTFAKQAHTCVARAGTEDTRACAQNGKESTDAVSYTHLTLPTICSV